MPIKLSDDRLASLYKSLQNTRRADPGVKIDSKQALKFLAAIGDRRGRNATLALAALSRPGQTPQQKIRLVRAGMDANERKDLAMILDAPANDPGTVPLTASVRAFFEKVLDRGTSPTPATDEPKVTIDQPVSISDTVRPGVFYYWQKVQDYGPTGFGRSSVQPILANLRCMRLSCFCHPGIMDHPSGAFDRVVE